MKCIVHKAKVKPHAVRWFEAQRTRKKSMTAEIRASETLGRAYPHPMMKTIQWMGVGRCWKTSAERIHADNPEGRSSFQCPKRMACSWDVQQKSH